MLQDLRKIVIFSGLNYIFILIFLFIYLLFVIYIHQIDFVSIMPSLKGSSSLLYSFHFSKLILIIHNNFLLTMRKTSRVCWLQDIVIVNTKQKHLASFFCLHCLLRAMNVIIYCFYCWPWPCNFWLVSISFWGTLMS